MKSLLTILAVVAFIGGSAFADTLSIAVVKDADLINYHEGQGYPPVGDEQTNGNGGGVGARRIANKDYFGIYDFATHLQGTSGVQPTSTLTSWLSSRGITNGTSLAVAITAGSVKVQLAIAQNGTGLSTYVDNVKLANAPVDWVETGCTNPDADFQWGSGVAATDMNPQQVIPDELGGIVALGKGWGPAGGEYLRGGTGLLAGNMTWDAVSNSYAYADLSAEAVRQLFDVSTNRGLYAYSTGSNGTGYFREQSGGAFAPQLVFSDVPEPATMGLLLIGGIGALLRRRK